LRFLQFNAQTMVIMRMLAMVQGCAPTKAAAISVRPEIGRTTPRRPKPPK